MNRLGLVLIVAAAAVGVLVIAAGMSGYLVNIPVVLSVVLCVSAAGWVGYRMATQDPPGRWQSLGGSTSAVRTGADRRTKKLQSITHSLDTGSGVAIKEFVKVLRPITQQRLARREADLRAEPVILSPLLTSLVDENDETFAKRSHLSAGTVRRLLEEVERI